MNLSRKTIAVLLGLGLSCAASLLRAANAPAENPPTIVRDQEPDGSLSTRGDSARLFSAPSIEWELHKTADGAHPDGNEQAMVWLMNRARTHPTAEGVFLAATGDADIEAAVEFFKVNLDAMKAEFSALSARPPAAFDRRIYQGSVVHSLDMIARDAQDHAEQFDRVTAEGFEMTSASASVFSYAKSPAQAHGAFNIDWGAGTADGMQVGRGHRVSLMNSGDTLQPNVGIAMVSESDSSTKVGPLVTSIVYARASAFSEDHFNKFLVGTVWTDANDNGLYDSGEGLPGVTVMPNAGVYYAVTGDAGGYAIPVAADGAYTVTFSGGDLAAPETRSALVDGESALVVWNAADSYNRSDSEPLGPLVTVVRVDAGIQVSWTAIAELDYTLERFDLATAAWVQDSRTIHAEGSSRYFLVSEDEIERSELLRIRVDGVFAPGTSRD